MERANTVPGTSVSENPPAFVPVWGRPYSVSRSIVLSLAIYAVTLYLGWMTVNFIALALPAFWPQIYANASRDLAAITRNGLGLGITACIQGAVGCLLLGFAFMFSQAPVRDYLGAGRPGMFKTLAAMGLLLPVMLALVLVSSAASRHLGHSPSQNFWGDAYRTATPPYPLWIGVGFLGPLFEEGLFRGLLFQGIRRSTLGAWGAVLLTSALWALSHFMIYGAREMAWIFAYGIVLGLLRHRWDSTRVTFLLHMEINVILMGCGMAGIGRL